MKPVDFNYWLFSAHYHCICTIKAGCLTALECCDPVQQRKTWQKQLKISHLKKVVWTNYRIFFLLAESSVCVSRVTGYIKGEIQLITRQDMQVCKWKSYVLVFMSMIILDLSGFTQRSSSFFAASLPFDWEVVAAKMQMQPSRYFSFMLPQLFFCRVGRHKSPNIIITASWTDARSNPNSWPHGEEEVNEGKRAKNGNKSGSWHGGKTVQTGSSHATWRDMAASATCALTDRQAVSGMILRLCWNHWNQLFRFSTSATRDLAHRRHADSVNLKKQKRCTPLRRSVWKWNGWWVKHTFGRRSLTVTVFSLFEVRQFVKKCVNTCPKYYNKEREHSKLILNDIQPYSEMFSKCITGTQNSFPQRSNLTKCSN